jgi:hypothetical protein
MCASCDRLSPAEKKIVGEWKTHSIGGEIVTAIHADHTWTSDGGCIDGVPPIHGRWRVDGSDIVFYLDSGHTADSSTPAPVRQRIQQIIDDDRQVRSWANHPPKK